MARPSQPPPPGTMGALVQRLRGDARSQEAFADLCGGRGTGFNQGAVSRWERNEDLPTIPQLRRMVEVAEGTDADLSEGLSLIAGLPVQVCTSTDPEARLGA